MTIGDVNIVLRSIDTSECYGPDSELLVYKSVVNALKAATEKGE